jgi:thiosulfate/3-mercaptopyruvate sulfurtransferase
VPPGPFVTAGQLGGELAGPIPPTVLDCRWELAGGADRAGYERGHLPGAVFVDLDRDLSAPPGPGGRHPLPAPAAFQAAMRRAGVGRRTPVVAYDQGEPGGAARAWWLLGYFGHPHPRVLLGGLPAWTAAGLPLSAETPTPAPGDFTAEPGHRPVLDAAAAAHLAATGVLLDARAPARYQGLQEPVDPVAGHIPGARNLPVTGLDLAAPQALRAGFEAVGAGHGAATGAYCGSGVVAAHLVLALEVAGLPAVLYPGSWSHWITDPSRPVAVGQEP